MITAKSCQVVFWEFIQNVLPVTGFILAISLWQRGEWGGAILCATGGSVGGALLIWATEARIVAGHREPARVVAANIAIMTMLTSALAAYLAADWSSWATDLLVGALAGVTLGVAQDVADKSPLRIRHILALGCAAPVGLVGVRVLVALLPAPATILIVTMTTTLIIVWIDYGSESLRRAE
ncbi:MAG: hypothetical protein KKA73_13880 [Chloroflexi bacterium]|nr:hypothetical protein [Chloroflexota bacterium]MBU1748773.1 hypothetical protein [Chloroflexota bacterium]MBU1878255.1 hypothetical protein [Chloroflexota bacterium]